MVVAGPDRLIGLLSMSQHTAGGLIYGLKRVQLGCGDGDVALFQFLRFGSFPR